MWELDVYLLYTIGIPQHSHYFSCVEWIAVELLFIKSTHNVRTLKTTTTMTTSKPNKTYKSLHRNSLFLFEVRNLPGMFFFPSINVLKYVKILTTNRNTAFGDCRFNPLNLRWILFPLPKNHIFVRINVFSLYGFGRMLKKKTSANVSIFTWKRISVQSRHTKCRGKKSNNSFNQTKTIVWMRASHKMNERRTRDNIRTHTPQTHTYTHARIKDVLMWHNEDALNINYKRKWPNQSDIRQKCWKIAFSFTSKQKKFLRIVKLKYLLVCSIFHCLIIVAFVIPAIWMIKIYTIYLFYLSNNLQETNGRECREGGDTGERGRREREK